MPPSPAGGACPGAAGGAGRGGARLADLAWPDVRDLAQSGALLAVPLGSTEQHGPHLPLSTDTDIAVALCERLAASRPGVLIAPAVAYGSSGEHAGFAGTLSIGSGAVELLVTELGRSASETFAHVLLVSAHGGNAVPVTRAVERLRRERRDVTVFVPRWHADPHAGRAETSMQLVLRPDAVRLERAVAGDTRPLPDLMPALRAGGVRAVSPSGVLGDPAGADPAEGAALLDALAAGLVAHVAGWLAPGGAGRAGPVGPA